MSSHGEIVLIGGSSVLWRSTSATIVCIHVVPHFEGVVMITSSSRSAKRSQRELSAMNPW